MMRSRLELTTRHDKAGVSSAIASTTGKMAQAKERTCLRRPSDQQRTDRDRQAPTFC